MLSSTLLSEHVVHDVFLFNSQFPFKSGFERVKD